MKLISCALCGANDDTLIFVGKDHAYHLPGEFNLVKCNNCGLIYLNPQPSEEELQKYYTKEYTPFGRVRGSGRGWVKRFVYARNLANIHKIFDPRARVLEIGCGNAEFLLFLRDKTNWELTGIESDEVASQQARDKLGLNVINTSLTNVDLAEEYFDLIIMKHVFEHLPDPNEALSKIKKALKKDGKILLWIPNVDSLDRYLFGEYWSGFDVPRHLYNFSACTISKFLSKHGFHLRQLLYDPVPNNWIWSIRYLCEEKGLPRFLIDSLNLDNLTMLAFFFPLSYLLSKMRVGGRIRILAERC